jgi:hypothetical protein
MRGRRLGKSLLIYSFHFSSILQSIKRNRFSIISQLLIIQKEWKRRRWTRFCEIGLEGEREREKKEAQTDHKTTESYHIGRHKLRSR